MELRFIGPDRPFSNIPTATMDECLSYCGDRSVLGVDTETSGLDFTKEKLLMLQIGDREQQFVIDARYVSIQPLKGILESQSILKVLQNVKFDYKFLLNNGIVLENVYDTMLAEGVLYCGLENMKVGLKDICLRRLNVDLDKKKRNTFIGMTGQPFTDHQIVYGADDIKYLLDIRDQQLPELEKEHLMKVAQLENLAVLAFGDIEYNGLIIDREEWLAISREEKILLVQAEKEMDDVVYNDPIFAKVVPKEVQGDLFQAPRKVTIKWSSPLQALKVLQQVLPKLENVNGKEMIVHWNKHKLIGMYIRYKEKAKVITSYGEKFLEFALSDGLIHTDLKQILNTGRIASKAPNIQNIPADNRFRNCFKAPPGCVFVSSDYAGQELCNIATGSKDPVWLKVLEAGEDLHSTCADLVYGPKWSAVAEPICAYYNEVWHDGKSGWKTKEEYEAAVPEGKWFLTGPKQKCGCKAHKSLRNNVKSISFGLAYGMGPNKLASKLEISLKEAEKLMEQYFQAFPNIKDFLKGLSARGIRYGYACTFHPFYRKRFFPGWFPGFEKLKENSSLAGIIERASANQPIQGTGADVTKLALYLIRREIRTKNLPVKIVIQVHDQIDTICTEEFSEEWKVRLTGLMEQAALRVITNGLQKADTNISKVWEK